MFNILVTDDEKYSRDFIKELILSREPEAHILEARSAKDAKAILEEEEIDFFFCDIKMPHGSGFDLLSALPDRDFTLVFVTAYKEYAIQAIKEGAVDYILKPINPQEFIEMFDKLVKKRREAEAKKYIAPFDSNPANSKLILSHQKGVKYIPLGEIIYMEASNVYTTIFLSTGEKIVSSKPIHRFEEILANQGFFRIHKSYLINISHFKEYVSKGSHAIVSNGDLLQISKFKLAAFLHFVEDHAGRIKA